MTPEDFVKYRKLFLDWLETDNTAIERQAAWDALENLSALEAKGIEEILSKIDSMTQRLANGLVPKEDIESMTAMRNGMLFGVSHKKKLAYDSGNSRRQASMEQRAKRTVCT